MAKELPKFDDKKTYMLSGKTLNLIMAAIRECSIVSVTGADIERTPDGVIIKIKP